MPEYRPAYSVIDLLVTMAVIIMLLSLLLPSLHRERSVARKITCTELQRQQFLATQMYAQDNHQRMPASNSQTHSRSSHLAGPYVKEITAGLLVDREHHGYGDSNYLQTADAMFCPELTIYPYRKTGHFAPITEGGDEAWSGYSWLYISLHSSWGRFACNDTLDAPGNRALNFDLAGWNIWAGVESEPLKTASLNPAHTDHVNVLYMDGHTESRPLTEINQQRTWTHLLSYLNDKESNNLQSTVPSTAPASSPRQEAADD